MDPYTQLSCPIYGRKYSSIDSGRNSFYHSISSFPQQQQHQHEPTRQTPQHNNNNNKRRRRRKRRTRRMMTMIMVMVLLMIIHHLTNLTIHPNGNDDDVIPTNKPHISLQLHNTTHPVPLSHLHLQPIQSVVLICQTNSD